MGLGLGGSFFDNRVSQYFPLLCQCTWLGEGVGVTLGELGG